MPKATAHKNGNVRTILQINQNQATPELITRIAAILSSSGVICLPTDTCYGLSCLATDSRATNRLRQLKQRSSSKPFILIASTTDQVQAFTGKLDAKALAIAEAFWPGRLTMVVPLVSKPLRLIYGLNSIAVRVPSSALLRGVMAEVNCPLWSTSANTQYSQVPAAVEDIPVNITDSVNLVLDGGRIATPCPSTIINLSVDPPTVIREGPIHIETILEKTGINVLGRRANESRC